MDCFAGCHCRQVTCIFPAGFGADKTVELWKPTTGLARASSNGFSYASARSFASLEVPSVLTPVVDVAGSLLKQNTLRVWKQAIVSNLGVASISNVAPYSSILIAINGTNFG